MLVPTPFYFLRHGETDWNREHRAQGQTDIPLNPTGIAQAHAAKARLAGLDIGTVCCSPLARARDTAEIVNQGLRRPLVVIEDLKECGFGSHEGRGRGSWYAEWRRGVTPDGGERYEDFLDRALRGINAALAHPGPVLIVAHAGIYWAIQRHGRLDPTGLLANGCPVRHDPPDAAVPGWTATELAGP